MFLDKKYVLASELVQKMDIHIANISILHKKLEDECNESDIIKLGNCSFINQDSPFLPKYIVLGLKKYKWTDISEMLPLSYIKREFNINDKIVNVLLTTNTVFKEKVEVAEKMFIKFESEFVKVVNNCNTYVLNTKETNEYLNDKTIDGSLQLDNNKHLTWYRTNGYSSIPISSF